jgi:hypothetical protein
MAQQKSLQYEIKAPGIGFHTTKYGTLHLKFTSKNILQLRDILASAAQHLTEQAVTLIEEERQSEISRMTPPPSAEEKHQQRVQDARKFLPNVTANGGMARRIIAASRIPPENRASMATRRATENSAAVGEAAADLKPDNVENIKETEIPHTIVTAGFEGPDDGTLGPPPASIR